jgi:hypothetical protein
VYLAALAHCYGAAGKPAGAHRSLEDLQRLSKQAYVSPVDLAVAHLGLGDASAALALLEQAVQERSPRIAFLGIDPHFDALRSDPRFQRLIARIGLSSPVIQRD